MLACRRNRLLALIACFLLNSLLFGSTHAMSSNETNNEAFLSTPPTSYLMQNDADDGFDSFFQQPTQLDLFSDSEASLATHDDYYENTRPTLFIVDKKSQTDLPTQLDELAANLSDFYEQSRVKWIVLKDLVELVDYMNAQQQLKSPVPSALIIDTRNSNEYNGWKAFTSASTDYSSAHRGREQPQQDK